MQENDNHEETRQCWNYAHNRKLGGSVHPNESVPIALFRKNMADPNSPLMKSCLDCRKHTGKIKAKSRKQLREQITNKINLQTLSQTRCCSNSGHNSLSNHQRENVPFELFLLDAENAKSKLFKMCIDCREYWRKRDKLKTEQLKQKKDRTTKENNDVRFCGGKHHKTKSGSVYECDKVPMSMFRKIPDNPKSDLFEICIDCRKYISVITTPTRTKLLTANIESSKTNGNAFCRECRQTKRIEQMYVRKDGQHGMCCVECKNKDRKRRDNLRKCYQKIQHEFIEFHECSCQICRCIIIKPINENSGCIKLKTYNTNSENYVEYQNKSYAIKDFLLNYHDLLELRVLEFDHLPEKEQRNKGILLDNEIYVPKKELVNQLTTEHSMRLESHKCQQLCTECHIVATMMREKGGRVINPREQEKLDYVNEQKKKGCSTCGYINLNLPRYFDMDHLYPKTKLDNVSSMVLRNKYSLEQVINECNLCRVLCKQCHKLHTHEQRKTGVVTNGR